MRTRFGWLYTAVLVVFCLGACGGGTPTSSTPPERFARSTSAIYMVNGLSSRVPDATAARLQAVMHVGETAKLRLNLQGEGYHNRERWTSTNAVVATVTPLPSGLPPGFEVVPTNPQALLTAVAVGEMTVLVDFNGPGEKDYRTTLGYCALDALYPGFPSLGPCGDPREISSVRVIP